MELQILLTDLGFYTGPIDGIWNPNSPRRSRRSNVSSVSRDRHPRRRHRPGHLRARHHHRLDHDHQCAGDHGRTRDDRAPGRPRRPRPPHPRVPPPRTDTVPPTAPRRRSRRRRRSPTCSTRWSTTATSTRSSACSDRPARQRRREPSAFTVFAPTDEAFDGRSGDARRDQRASDPTSSRDFLAYYIGEASVHDRTRCPPSLPNIHGDPTRRHRHVPRPARRRRADLGTPAATSWRPTA